MRIIIMFALFVTTLSNYAQETYNGIILDQNNNFISNALITEKGNSKNSTTSNTEGKFEINLENNQNVIVSFLGFQSKRVSLSQGNNTINLAVENEILDEILVSSASREVQKRSEVPAAITTITSSAIKDSKAFGIDQLVNQVPGVYMSTSRAASNEQHFMSVRSPISTKSLFLYLEDGLQIRPTSVFNHNALLEMNTTSIGKVEVLKGPASSIYGSESIGGSFNFITKNPTDKFSGSLGYQRNDIGLSKYEVELSKQTSKNFGFYLGTHFAERKDGPIEHSDYNKLAITFKTVYDITNSLKWSTVFDIIDYNSDMTGSLSETNYNSGNYKSDQTFTERDALAFRVRTTVAKQWSDQNKTSFNLITRKNQMDQNPSYRIRQFANQGELTGFGSGEVNSNKFYSYVGLVQHKTDFNFLNSSLILGASADYSPQEYVSESTSVIVDPLTGQNTSFTINEGDYNLNYDADIFNFSNFFQYEISPIKALKITSALRFDQFYYHQKDKLVAEGQENTTNDVYSNLSPKIGVNYNFNSTMGTYINYSQGFTPPQVSTLYRGRFELRDITPSRYHNYELGGYYNLSSKLKIDAALYLLEGQNTLITTRDDDNNFFSTNAGKTSSYGVEYGFTWMPIKEIAISHNGSYAKHKYIRFSDRGIDYSNTDRETAPNLLGTSIVSYKKEFENKFGFLIAAEHELVSKYNTSFEGQAEAEDGSNTTATYDGHSILNFRASISYKNIEIWGHFLNVFDELYAARASYNRFRKENSYTIGNPKTLHFGVKYSL